MHSLNIINVFSSLVFVRSLLLVFISFIFFKGTIIFIFIFVLLAILNCLNLYLIRTQKDVLYFDKFVKNIKKLK